MGSLSLNKDESNFLGANVEISIDAGLYKGSYPSRLEDINNEEWKLAHPFLGHGLLPLYRNLDLTLSIKNDDALYIVKASVNRAIKNGQVPYLLVRVLGDATKVQRRRFLRVPCLLDGVISPITSEEDSCLPDWEKGVIKDISLGGVRFSVKSKKNLCLNTSDKAILAIMVEGFNYFICCKVVMFRKNEDDTFVDLGLEFESLPGSVEKTFTYFVRQQELASRDERV